jgi:hypothetical protein
MAALQFPKGLRAHMRDVWLFLFSQSVTRNIDVFSEVPSGAVFPPVLAAHGDSFFVRFCVGFLAVFRAPSERLG